MPTVRSIVADAEKHEYRFSSIVLGIVGSAPFQKRTTPAVEQPGNAARSASRETGTGETSRQ
jgi:hypothetical protein